MAAPDTSYPRWTGPVIGAGVGFLIGLRCMQPVAFGNWPYPVGAALLGAVAGSLLWLIDAPACEGEPASVVGSVLAALALSVGCVPLLGLLIGVPAFLLNRRVAGWQNRASRWGLGLGVVLTLIVIAASQIPLR